MELVSLEQEAQMSRDGENSSMAPVRKTKPGSSSQDGSIKTTAATGVKLFWLLPVTIGIICVLQAVLNVSLRLTLLSHQKSLTEDRDRLKTIISEIEAKNRNLTQQRDELMRKTCNSHQKSLTEDRDQLKTIISEIEAKNRNLTQQRDELRKTCNSPQKALTEDRDQLKTIISDSTLGMKGNPTMIKGVNTVENCCTVKEAGMTIRVQRKIIGSVKQHWCHNLLS
ncbi:uncharacterized protein KZ484_019496 isoform 2-T2 [Pholidichthys leucotaenia]